MNTAIATSSGESGCIHSDDHLVKELVRLIAFYLPQYHPIPENDLWWGKGFTEWTNVAKALPQFKGHYQPHLPADLGFYDLRTVEARQNQADMARAYGLHGFCYYHYWFNGRRLLERPFNDVLSSGEPDFPFCLCWANENWSRNWDGGNREILVQQRYSHEDDIRHIDWLLDAFEDPRYIKIDGRPLFLVYRASQLPSSRRTTDLWREAAERRGFPGLMLCRVESFYDEQGDPRAAGFDAGIEFQPSHGRMIPTRGQRLLSKMGLRKLIRRKHEFFDYGATVEHNLNLPPANYPKVRCVMPSWDNTARRPRGGTIFTGSTPELYERWLSGIIEQEAASSDSTKLVFINAWNEWAEGNHLEPDQRFGLAYLEATASALRVLTK